MFSKKTASQTNQVILYSMAPTYSIPFSQESFNHINPDLLSIKDNNSTRVSLLLCLVKTSPTCHVLHLVRFQTRIQDKLNFILTT